MEDIWNSTYDKTISSWNFASSHTSIKNPWYIVYVSIKMFLFIYYCFLMDNQGQGCKHLLKWK